MFYKLILSTVILSMVMYSCTSDEGENTPINQKINPDVVAGLLVTNCYSCHTTDGQKGERIAPTMAKVKDHYLEVYPAKGDFLKAMSAYVNSPSKDKVIMQGALNKYGVMPNMQFSKTDIGSIVDYLYENSIDSKAWIAKYSNASIPEINPNDYMTLGRHIVMSTKKQLGKNLKKTIKTKGTKEAVTFCNLKAYPITDSMSIVHNAIINRVSNKNRNPNNKANNIETNYISNYQTQLNNGEELKPILKETNDKATFYMPIVTNEMCLKCHGNSNSIESETLAEIKKLYPLDLATGYDVKQIRGVWRIEIKK